GQFLVNRGCDAKLVQVPKQLFPPGVAPKADVFGAAGRTRKRAAQGVGQEVGQVVDVRGVFHREVVQGITLGESGDHPQVVRLGHGHVFLGRFGAFALFATNSESSPPWKKIMPCSSSPFTKAQPRPWAASISALPSQDHSTAGSPSLVVWRQSIWPWTLPK